MSSQTEQRAGEVVQQVRARLGEKFKAEAGAEIDAFAQRFFARVAPDDVLSRGIDNLYGAVLSLWKFAEKRQPGAAELRAFNPKLDQDGWASPHTVVEIVNDDMPFLVDTVAMTLTGLGHKVQWLIHPVATTRRSDAGKRLHQGGTAWSESLMHVEIGALTDATAIAAIEARLSAALGDVRAAVADWRAMLGKLDDAVLALERRPPPIEADEVAEAVALLRWMAADNFTFLGYREYDYAAGQEAMRIVEGTGLGILRQSERRVMISQEGALAASDTVLRFLRRHEALIVTKANARSTVHRPVLLDYVGVRRFDDQGNAVGEYRFVGLFTSAAYNRNPRDIPLLRRKVARVIERAGLAPQSHDGKALLNILETYPRDELFQIGEADLEATAGGILLLQQQPRTRLFVRRDEFDRFVSVLVFVPREAYGTALRERVGALLREAFAGRISNFYTQVGDEPLARIHFIVAVTPGRAAEPDIEALERRVAAATRTWADDLAEALNTHCGEERGGQLWRRYAGAFPAGYRERYDPAVACADIERIDALGPAAPIAVNLHRPLEAGAAELRFKLYRVGQPVALSDCLPMLEHLGLKVIEEHPFKIEAAGEGEPVWLHDLSLLAPPDLDIVLDRVKDKFETAFIHIWQGAMEDDRFNRLVLLARLEWREIVVLRAICKYLRQAGIAFSQAYMEEALCNNAGLARMMVGLFHQRFEPKFERERDARAAEIEAAIALALDQVASLDEDRILRRFLNVIGAMRRTNFYQRDAVGAPKPYLSFKLESAAVDELPLPRPFVEIFVYSPRMEGIHLRGGRVARGGIRWSDRREDFRTEILGLMKAQQVKNAVIVPVGAKGGFVPKRPPVDGGREAVQADGIECYRTLIRGLLDITDNHAGDRIVPPDKVVRRDGDDPYLVVAADKGTATFSDIANALSLEYGFWLGDAFASGGSAGYDHKKMGITARGAWEMVKRHFRELGTDIQAEDFTVVGIGDMSGDVFGNGMLLSPHIRLLAAFDHRHIFVDPDPVAAVAFRERRRLFDLPRSSWADYDAKLISAGGGAFDRKAKSVRLTPEIKARFGIERDSLTPTELIRVLLTAEVDLLWNGGIGTYVKAASETSADVGDRANDALRVDGRDLRAKVVGEGGNLGFTQRGRIEYALRGGRINTDALDNSAGVDTSDHEVNIKILLDAVVAAGDLTIKQRDKLMAEMSDELAALILQDNYLQGQAVSVAEAQGTALLPSFIRLMRSLEQRGRLDRAVEFLPDNAALLERQNAGSGLTRPEIAVLLAYAKMSLYDDLLDSDLPDETHFAVDLAKYFPRPLRKNFQGAIDGHRLRREIVATSVANSIINRVGPGFVGDIREETEADAAAIARVYVVSRD
ncbi:MAG TPA: NAD-glutamate dehydrogenase, partial [Candidatus Sulfotelmatobacter sp.]|nr:NAD-glutamate dehydrogenase [Candidatus Sulfotelmatobacter sp.]